MLFNLEFDEGDVIEGYLIPDGFSDQPVIRICGEEGELARFPCNQARPAVFQAGRHATGMVGFRLDETNMPGLASMRHIEIFDAKTGLLIYRRPGLYQPVPMKLLRLEFRMLPFVKFDRLFGRYFQYDLSALERFGHETAMQAFHLNAVNSIYLSGRLYLRGFEEFLDKGFQVIGHLPDPYYEMASRLAILNRMTQTKMPFISDRDRLILAPAAEYFAHVTLDDDRALKKALQQAEPKIRNVLISPTTRQLVCTSPDQMISRRDVAPAIDFLSRFLIVGQDGSNLDFEGASAELLGVSPETLPSYGRHSVLEGLADRLRQLPIAETMLEEDLILHHYVREAANLDAPNV